MKNSVVIVFFCCLLFSCNSSKSVIYMRKAVDGDSEKITIYPGIVIQPKDQLCIVVSSKDPQLAMVYNLPLLTYQAGSGESASGGGYMQRLLGYTVDFEGNIDFPVLGKINVGGFTRDQVSEIIKQKLIQAGQLLDPIVTTEFMNFKITVLGEVRNPGTFTIVEDRITIFEALGRAGDMTIYGRRDNILVRREQNGYIDLYRVNILGTDINSSPAFYLRQNDVIYVEPNNTMAARTRINENKSIGVWVSVASLLTSIASMAIIILQ